MKQEVQDLSSRVPCNPRSLQLTSRQDVGRGRFEHLAGSRGAVTKYTSGAETIPLPSGSIASPVPALKSLNLTQAVLDGLVVVGGLLALVAVFGSLPLAVGLMIFGIF